MPRTGNGTYTLPTGNPVITDTVITSDWANTTMSDLGAAITASLAADGQTVPSGNLPMGGFHHLSVSDPTLRDQYTSLGMVQDGRQFRVNITAGPNALIGTLVGQMSSYTPGMILSFQAANDNTSIVTLNVNGIGSVPVVNTQGVDLLSGDLRAGKFYLVQYNGSAFSVISGTSGGTSTLAQNKTTGQNRPSGGYPVITQLNATTVTVPAGSAVIVPPGNASYDEVITVSWAAQNVVLAYLATGFSTTLAVDSTGAIVQIQGMPSDAALRSSAILGTISHVNGVMNGISTRGLTFGDDGYLTKDVGLLISNVLVTGGRVTANGSNTLQMNVAAGTIFIMGADLVDEDSPNALSFAGGSAVSFFPVTGNNTVGAAIQTTPVANYDPNGAGTVTAIGGGATACVIHRLFYLYGAWVWSYGQQVYTDLNTALGRIEADRSDYLVPSKLSDATLVAEIVAQKNTTNLGDNVTAKIINRGGFNFQIGTSGSIGEAPSDGNTYGRNNATWVRAISRTGDTMTGDLQFRKNTPSIELSSPTNVNGYRVFSDVTDGIDAGWRWDRRVAGSWVPLMTFNGTLANWTCSLTAAGDIKSTAAAAETRAMVVGAGRAGNGISSMDLVGDATYPLGGFRNIRNAGANATTQTQHRGTGKWSMVATEAADVSVGNNGADRMLISGTDGRVSFPGLLDSPMVSGAAATARYSWHGTAGVPRWSAGANSTNESGSNAGSDWSMISYNDAGAPLANVLTVTRATGVFGFLVPPTAPTQAPGSTGTKLATLDFVAAAVAAVSGIPDAPADGFTYGRNNNAWVITGGGGGGGVVSVGVATAAGVSGSVANPTTNAVITITLGNITPASVVSPGIVTGTTVKATTGNHTGTAAAAVLATDAVSGANGTVGLRPDGTGSATGELLVGNTTITHAGVVLPNKTYVDAQDATKLARDPAIQLLASASTITAAAADDAVIVTALAVPATIANPAGAAANERRLWFRIKDNGTARALTWGSEFRSCGQTLPTTTVAGKTMRVGFLRNATDIRWDCVALAQEA